MMQREEKAAMNKAVQRLKNNVFIVNILRKHPENNFK